jgi:hypothetical protein
MKKSALLIAAAVAAAEISWFLLPQDVVVQVGLNGQATRTMPKLLAIGIPFAIAVVGAVMNIWEKNQIKPKGFLISVIGIAAMVLSLLFNR